MSKPTRAEILVKRVNTNPPSHCYFADLQRRQNRDAYFIQSFTPTKVFPGANLITRYDSNARDTGETLSRSNK